MKRDSHFKVNFKVLGSVSTTVTVVVRSPKEAKKFCKKAFGVGSVPYDVTYTKEPVGKVYTKDLIWNSPKI